MSAQQQPPEWAAPQVEDPAWQVTLDGNRVTLTCEVTAPAREILLSLFARANSADWLLVDYTLPGNELAFEPVEVADDHGE